MGEEDEYEETPADNEDIQEEEDSSTNVSEEKFDTVEEYIEAQNEDAPSVDSGDSNWNLYDNPLGLMKKVTEAKTALFKSGHYDKVKVAFVGKEWQVVWGTDIVEIARKANKPYEFVKLGRMKKSEVNEYYFRCMLADGNLSRTQIALLAAKYMSIGDIDAGILLESYSDQLTETYLKYAATILHHDKQLFEKMLQHGKVRIGTSPVSSLKVVAMYVRKRAEKRRQEREALQAAAMDFISLQASQGVAKEDLAQIMKDMATSLAEK